MSPAKEASANQHVAVFLDYENVDRLGHSLFGRGLAKRQTSVSPRLIADTLVAKRNRPSELARVFVVRGEPSRYRDPNAAAAFRRQSERWSSDPLVEATYLPLCYDSGQAKEKGVDSRLALDVVRVAQTNIFDALIIFTGDQDLLPAIQDASGSPTRIEVAVWTSGEGYRGSSIVRREAKRMGLWCHPVSEDDFWDCQDIPIVTAA